MSVATKPRLRTAYDKARAMWNALRELERRAPSDHLREMRRLVGRMLDALEEARP